MAALALALAFLAAHGTVSAAQQMPGNFSTPVTVPFQPGTRIASAGIPLNDPTVAGAAYAGTPTPTEVHIAPAGPNAMYIMWATMNYTVGSGALTPLNPNTTTSVVKYGTSASSLSMTANGTAEIYNQIYALNSTGVDPYAVFAQEEGQNVTLKIDQIEPNVVPPLNYTSPLLHTVVLANLTPGTQYFYQVGSGNATSGIYNFTSLTAPGPTYPQRVILLADWGASYNSTQTRDHAIASANQTEGIAPIGMFVGDFSYSDGWWSNGTVIPTVPAIGFEGQLSATYQPVWDLWQRMIEPLVSHIPFLTCVGNHEIEQQEDANNTIFASVQARWKVPSAQANSPSYFFWSAEAGPIHSIQLSIYQDYTPGSPQWNWLYQDLLSVNRTKTPWVTVQFHNPIYDTSSSFKEMEALRLSMEPLWYSAGVDIVFNGHIHAYERSFPAYNYQNDPCGIVHIMIGDAGNSEGLSFLEVDGQTLQFEDLNGGCPNVTVGTRPTWLYSNNPNNDPFTYYKRALTFQADGNSTGVGNPPGYCYKEQPAWSAFRSSNFGHGVLDILNSTTALWQFNMNQDTLSVSADSTYITRNTTACPNKMYPMIRSTNGAQMPASA